MWYRRVVSYAAGVWVTSISKYASAHPPAAIEGSTSELGDPGRRFTFGFAESQTKLTETFVVATLLHTRAPTGKSLGPAAGLLLSRPTTFQVSGATVRVVAARAANENSEAITVIATRRACVK